MIEMPVGGCPQDRKTGVKLTCAAKVAVNSARTGLLQHHLGQSTLTDVEPHKHAPLSIALDRLL